MIIAVASGKGGTGKTTLAVNLAEAFGSRVQLLDCDVEEPNDHLFLGGDWAGEEVVTIPVPKVDENLCNGCGECSRFCQCHAIAVLATGPLVFPEMCHGCGGCARICPTGAITETGRRIGVVSRLQSGHIELIHGCLDVGVATVPPLIHAVKARLQRGVPAILDAPPGTSCPVVATLRGVDYVVLVTEPTPFGLHDLGLAADMVRALGLPFGVVVNRVGIGDDRVHVHCRRQAIPILAEIPEDRRIAEVYSRGGVVVRELPEYRALFSDLNEKIAQLAQPAGAADGDGPRVGART
ncbi:MAG: ATP-binding protein [bacterium]|nr:ATP-binding protein [bacterium]